jgi:hypothetical protein
MRADAARADRAHAVRTAADGWRRAGAIDATTLLAIAAVYPDDRVRLGLGFRVLAGLAAFVGAGAFAGLLASVFLPGATILNLGLAVLFTVATEVQIGRLRRAQAGAEYATAILAASSAGIAWLSISDSPSIGLVCCGFAMAFAVAAWRWGYALFAALAAVFVLLACSQGNLSRAVWLVLGCAALTLILGSGRSPRWPPAHRRCFAAAGLVFLAGAYVATNLYSLDRRWVEVFQEGGVVAAGAWARRAAIAGTILMPPIVLCLGGRFRERGFLAAGALFTSASLVTLRHYHPIGPWWLSLILGGAGCLALAVALRRWLDSGPGRERRGFTAEPLFEDRRMVEAAQAAATLVAMSSGPRGAPEAPFDGGGGRSGGGGATGRA